MAERRILTAAEKRMVAMVARNLQWAYSEKTTGEGRKWEGLGDDERKLWVQLTRRALNKFDAIRQEGSNGLASADASATAE